MNQDTELQTHLRMQPRDIESLPELLSALRNGDDDVIRMKLEDKELFVRYQQGQGVIDLRTSNTGLRLDRFPRFY